MTKTTTTPTKQADAFKKLVDICVEARIKFEKAEVEYLAFLSTVETRQRSSWIGACASFEEFIETFLGKPEPIRWRNYKRAEVELGHEKIAQIGLDAALALLKVHQEKRPTLERNFDAWVSEHGGVHPSARLCKDMLMGVQPREVIPNPVRRLEELLKLRAEVDVLRRENARLEKRNRELEAMVAPGPKKTRRNAEKVMGTGA